MWIATSHRYAQVLAMTNPPEHNRASQRAAGSGGPQQAELGQRGDAIIEAHLLGDSAVDHLQHRQPKLVELSAGSDGLYSQPIQPA